MDANNLKELQKITTPKVFPKGEYICHEGQPGSEMYIIMKGSVGIYICSPMGEQTEVSRLGEGEFFGEMAIFDNLPRSASCIALQDTVCVAINEGNIETLFTCCPDIAKKLVVTMSGRIRQLNKELYKSSRKTKKRRVAKFAIPSAYGFNHVVAEPYQSKKYLDTSIYTCPICGEDIITTGIRRNILPVRKMRDDGRVYYYECEPLWYEILQCPNCHYSNQYQKFFAVEAEEIDTIKRLLKEEHLPVLEKRRRNTAFDLLVQKYLQAIHINEHINQDNYELIGTLWLKLYWLGEDSGDDRFAEYCAKNAVKKLKMALDGVNILNSASKCFMALSLAHLLLVLEDKDDALEYCSIVLECSEPKIVERAKRLQKQIED